MKNLLIRWFISAVAVWVAAQVVDGMELTRSVVGVLIVAAVLGLVNALIRPVVVLLSLPGLVLTLGLLTFLINALMLWVTDALTAHLYLRNFWAALWGSVVISIVSALLSIFLEDKRGRRD